MHARTLDSGSGAGVTFYVPRLFSVCTENGALAQSPYYWMGKIGTPLSVKNPYLLLSDGSSGWLGFLIASLAWAYSWTGLGTSKAYTEVGTQSPEQR